MNHFKWLAEEKKMAAEKKMMNNGRNGRPGFAVTPVRARYMGNTGYGEDGVLQEDNPTHMLNTNQGRRMVHEGEDMYLEGKDQVSVIPAKYSQGMLRKIEKDGNVPGYQTGTTSPVTVISGNGRANLVNGVATTTPPTDAPKSMVESVAYDPPKHEVFKMPRIEPMKTATTPTIRKSSAPVVPEFDMPMIPQTSSFEIPEVRNTYSPPPTTLIDPQAATNYNRMQEGNPVASAPESMETASRNTALGRMGAMARGDFSAINPELQKNLDNMKATMDVEQQVAAQQAAQQGLSPEVAASRQAMGRISGRQAMADAQGQIATARLNEQASANQQLASESLAGQQFEQDKAQYQDTQGWRTYEAAIAAGDFTTAANAYKTVTGKDINMDQMKRYQNYMNTKQDQDIASGELGIQELRTKLGDQKWNSIQDRINKGMSAAQINAEFGPNTISEAEYQSMLDATPLGERNWGRNLAAANTLLQTGGAANIAKAGEIFNNVFPGIGIDFSQKIKDDNYKTVSRGISKMSDYIAANMTWDEAFTAMQKDGTMDDLDMDYNEARKLWDGMKVNAIDDMWRETEESQTFQSLSDEDKEAVRAIFADTQFGLNDWKVVDEYDVFDKSGNKISTVTSEDAAKKAAEKAGGTFKATGTKRAVPKDNNDLSEEFSATLQKVKETGNIELLKDVEEDSAEWRAIMEELPTNEWTYSDKDWINDTFENAPEAGEIIRITHPTTGKTIPVKVTFKGHLERAADTSDFAYMEFKGVDGTMYSTSVTKNDKGTIKVGQHPGRKW